MGLPLRTKRRIGSRNCSYRSGGGSGPPRNWRVNIVSRAARAISSTRPFASAASDSAACGRTQCRRTTSPTRVSRVSHDRSTDRGVSMRVLLDPFDRDVQTFLKGNVWHIAKLFRCTFDAEETRGTEMAQTVADDRWPAAVETQPREPLEEHASQIGHGVDRKSTRLNS